MSSGPFIPPVGTPQNLFGNTTGSLVARVGALETSRRPARFELVSEIAMPVIAGDATWMMVMRDMDQFRLIDLAAGVYTVSPADDITVMVSSLVYGDLLSTELTILASEQNSYPSLPDIIPGQPLFAGDILTFTVVDEGADAAGLAFAPSFG